MTIETTPMTDDDKPTDDHERHRRTQKPGPVVADPGDLPIRYMMANAEDNWESGLYDGYPECPVHGELDSVEELTVERFGRELRLEADRLVRYCQPCLEEVKGRELADVEADIKPALAREIERKWKAHPLPDGKDLGAYFETAGESK